MKKAITKESGGRFVAVDVETSGFAPRRGGRVIEIGAVAIENGEVADEFESLVNPRCMIHWGAFRVHGISMEMLEGEPGPEEVMPGLKEFIGDSTVLAHNAPFDMGFLRSEFARLGLELRNKQVCTCIMSRKLLPELPSHSLESVARHLLSEGRPLRQSHRALDDARLCAMIWMRMQELPAPPQRRPVRRRVKGEG
jgi:DNA polymerase-3 subunit epsilon